MGLFKIHIICDIVVKIKLFPAGNSYAPIYKCFGKYLMNFFINIFSYLLHKYYENSS